MLGVLNLGNFEGSSPLSATHTKLRSCRVAFVDLTGHLHLCGAVYGVSGHVVDIVHYDFHHTIDHIS